MQARDCGRRRRGRWNRDYPVRSVPFAVAEAAGWRCIAAPNRFRVESVDSGVLQDTLMKLERQRWDSLCDGTGAEFYGRVMAEDGVMVLANGAVMDRASFTPDVGGCGT